MTWRSFQSSACIQNLAWPGVSVNDDVVESDRHIDSVRGALGCISRTHTLLAAGRVRRQGEVRGML